MSKGEKAAARQPTILVLMHGPALRRTERARSRDTARMGGGGGGAARGGGEFPSSQCCLSTLIAPFCMGERLLNGYYAGTKPGMLAQVSSQAHSEAVRASAESAPSTGAQVERQWAKASAEPPQDSSSSGGPGTGPVQMRLCRLRRPLLTPLGSCLATLSRR